MEWVFSSPFLPGLATNVQSSSQTVNSAFTVSLPAVANHTNYLCGFYIVCSAQAAIAAPLVAGTNIFGLTGGNYNLLFGVTQTGASLFCDKDFVTPWPASAPNTAISLTLPALGAGIVVNAGLYGFVF